MATPVRTALDFGQNEVQNARIQNLASAPSSPVEGQVYYNSTGGNKAAYFWNGTAWVAMQSDAAAALLTKLLTVDGAASGLDADLLDGQEGIYYLSRANHTGTQLAATISNFDAAVRTSRLDQMAAPTGPVAMNSQNITGLAAATAAGHAVEYAQWQSAINGTKWKLPVRVLATGNLALTGTQTIDGVAVVAGDRVGAFSQTTSTQDGIYVVAAGAWSRAADMAAGTDAANAAFFVSEGTTNADTQQNVTNNAGSAVVGTDNLVLAQIGAGTAYSADESSLHLTGTTFSIKTTWVGQTSIATLGTVTTGTWNATVIGLAYGGLGVDASAAAGKLTARQNLNAPGKYSSTIGDGATNPISITQATHGLAANATLQVVIYEVSTGAQVIADVTVNNTNGTVTVGFSAVPTAAQYRVVING